MNPASLLGTWGYAGLFAGVFLEGESILVLAGFAAHRGYLRLPLVILAAVAATLVADQGLFHLGRRRGASFLRSRPGWEGRAARVRRLVAGHATLIALGFRFVYGFRTVTPVVLGVSGMNPWRFLPLNAASGLAWATAFACAGYFSGATLEYLLGDLRRHEGWIMGGLLLLAAGLVLGRSVRARGRREAAPPRSGGP